MARLLWVHAQWAPGGVSHDHGPVENPKPNEGEATRRGREIRKACGQWRNRVSEQRLLRSTELALSVAFHRGSVERFQAVRAGYKMGSGGCDPPGSRTLGGRGNGHYLL